MSGTDLENLRQLLILEYGSSTMDLIDDYADGKVSKMELSYELGSSAMDIADDYKKLKQKVRV